MAIGHNGGKWILSAVQLLSRVQLFVTPWTAARQASLSITNSQSLLKLMFFESVMPSNHLIFRRPFQSFPASGAFPVSQFFILGGQSIGVSTSASVLPMNIQDWFPLGLIGLISLLSEGLSRAFSSTRVWRHEFFSAKERLLLFGFKYGSGLPRWLSSKESTCNAGDVGLIPGSGIFPGAGNGNPL